MSKADHNPFSTYQSSRRAASQFLAKPLTFKARSDLSWVPWALVGFSLAALAWVVLL